MGYKGTMNPFETVKEEIDYSPKVGDEVKFSTCYMCACRCGIKVHLKDGKPRYIEGNPDHPVNKGVLCAKGSSGIMHWNAPGKLTKPLLRVGERGSGEFKEIEWDEAMKTAAEWLCETRRKDPGKLAFFTGRDQSQSLTGWWASRYGTHNFAAHGGFCSVNMAAGGLYTLGGAFWEFGDPDFDRTKYFMMLGVADDHDSNPIKTGLGKMKTRGDCKFVAVNPSRNGYGAIADEWVGIRPGTDGLFIFAIIHELLRAEKVDFPSLARYSNAPWLVIDNPGKADHGLFLRNKKGDPLIWDLKKKKAVSAHSKTITPAFAGERKVAGKKVVPSFSHLAERYMAAEYAPDAVAEECGIPADTIRRIAAELAYAAFEEEVVIDEPWTDAWGKTHDKMIGRPVAIHAMRGISAHSNGFHTCRAIHVLQALLGSVDTPGGWRYKPPYPQPIPPGAKPTPPHFSPLTPMSGPPAGFPTDPSHLVVDDEGQPLRIDKAFSWEHPLSLHGMMHMVLRNAATEDPYGIDVLFMFMANMAWNSSMNIGETLGFFTAKNDDGSYKIPKIIYSDAFYSETVPYCDLILPDTTYLERYDCLSVLDRPFSQGHGVADGIRQPVIELDRDVRTFQTVLLELGAMLDLPGMINEDGTPKYPGGYPDYLVNHERKPGLGPLAGWRGKNGDKFGRGEPNPKQLEKYIENGCFWEDKMPMSKQFFKHANQEYLEYATEMGWIGEAKPIIHQLYNEDLQRFRLAAQGHGEHQPPDEHRERTEQYFDPLPMWYKPFEERDMDASGDTDEYPIHALSQRPMHMYHSWGSQNTWLRQITNVNKLHIHKDMAADLGIVDDDWVWIEGRHGRVKGQVKLITGVNKNTVWTWNAMGKRKGAWGLKHDAPEFNQAFLLNHIISDVLKPNKHGHEYSNSDPVTGQAAWYDLRVKITKCAAEEFGFTEPMYEAPNGPISDADISQYGKDMQGEPTSGRADIKEWIGQRHANAGNISGIKDGHGNKTSKDNKGDKS